MAIPARSLIEAARRLGIQADKLKFSAPVEFVYNPLSYAWDPHEEYLRKYGMGAKRVVFLGMNPGPFGMAQTGIPFGEIAAVRDWLGLKGLVKKPLKEHPDRPVSGFECLRSEVSGKRLWGLFSSRFGTAQNFFTDHIVMNYCPLVFMEASGKNRTPDKLTLDEKAELFTACDQHLSSVINETRPEWVIGVGAFAAERAEKVVGTRSIKVGQILHPSPANPSANKNWASHVTNQLEQLGVWSKS